MEMMISAINQHFRQSIRFLDEAAQPQILNCLVVCFSADFQSLYNFEVLFVKPGGVVSAIQLERTELMGQVVNYILCSDVTVTMQDILSVISRRHDITTLSPEDLELARQEVQEVIL